MVGQIQDIPVVVDCGAAPTPDDEPVYALARWPPGESGVPPLGKFGTIGISLASIVVLPLPD